LRPGDINTLNAKLNPICHFLALLGAHHILHVSGVRVKGAGAIAFKLPDIFLRFEALTLCSQIITESSATNTWQI